MFAAGITSFKMYLTYPAMMIGDGAVYSALKALKKRGGIAGVHCENAGVIDARIAELKAAGRAADVSSHPEARPDYLEAEAVARLLRIAEAADAPVIIVHLTNREALDEIAFARARGQRVYVETCPQYLALDDGVYYDANWSMAARYVCAPPIRAEENQRALWRGLRRGEIQTNPEAARALEQMPKIHGLDFHSTVLITADDEAVLRKLRVNATCEPKTEGGKLF